MNLSYEQAAQGRLPDKTPCEVYCHTLTDNSILSPALSEQGYHTMTLFGLDAPWSLFARDNGTVRKEAEKKFLASMNQWLEEPLENCLAVGRDGTLCLESKSPVDIEDSLGMYHGNIFHDAPTWPFATENSKRDLGRRDGIRECLLLRIERATWRRRQWHSRAQCGAQGPGGDEDISKTPNLQHRT